MSIHPRNYNINEFKKFLEDNHVEEKIIKKFLELPELVTVGNNKYKIYLTSTRYNDGDIYYNYELNYYCESLMEFLFPLKVFGEVELSINTLLLELKKFI